MWNHTRNIPKNLTQYWQLRKYTNASHNGLFAFQSKKMMEILIPRIQTAPKPQDLDSLWKICQLMMKKYTRQDWKSLEQYLWDDLLDSVGKMDQAEEKQGSLIKYRNSAVSNGLNTTLLGPNLNIASLDCAKEWVESVREHAPSSLEDDTLNQTLFSSFKSMSTRDFLDVCSLFETEFQWNRKTFLDHLLSQYTSKKQIPLSWTEADQRLYVTGLSQAGTLIQDLSSLLPDRDFYRKLLLLLDYWNDRSLSVWNSVARIMRVRKYKDIQVFLFAMEQRNVVPNMDTFMIMMENLSPIEMRKLLTDVQERNIPSGTLLLEYCKNCLNREAIEDALNVYSFHSDKKGFFGHHAAAYVYQSLLIHTCYDRNTTAVMQLIYDAKEYNFEVPQDIASAAIVTLCKSLLPEVAQFLFEEHRTCHDSYAHDDIFAISNAYIVMKKYTAALQFARLVIQRRGIVGKRTRKVILKGLLDSNNVEDAEKWLLECLKHKDIEMIEMICTYFVATNSLEKSHHWIHFAKERGFPSTNKLMVKLVTAMIKDGQISPAMDIIQELQGTLESVDQEIYATFLEEFIKSASWTQFELLWSGLQQKELVDSWTVQYVRYLTFTDRIELIHDLIPKIKIETHPRTFQQLILVLLRTNQSERALELLQEFRKVGATVDHAYAISYFVSHHAR
jgi:hypothetical protein